MMPNAQAAVQQPAMPPAMAQQQPEQQGSPPGQLDQSMLQKVTMAAQRLMYDPATRGYFLSGLKKPGNPVDVMAAEVVGIIKLLDDKSNGKLPRQIIAPVAIAVLIESVHFAAQAGFFVMQRADIAACAKKIIAVLMQQYGADATGEGALPRGTIQNQEQNTQPQESLGLIQSAQRGM